MPLYRRVEPNMQLGEFKCEEFVRRSDLRSIREGTGSEVTAWDRNDAHRSRGSPPDVSRDRVLRSRPVAVAQQGPAAAAGHLPSAATPDGQPDLQGYWTNLTYTPFERPKELAGKPFYTEQEAIDAFNKAVEDSFTTDQIVHYVQSDFGPRRCRPAPGRTSARRS